MFILENKWLAYPSYNNKSIFFEQPRWGSIIGKEIAGAEVQVEVDLEAEIDIIIIDIASPLPLPQVPPPSDITSLNTKSKKQKFCA